MAQGGGLLKLSEKSNWEDGKQGTKKDTWKRRGMKGRRMEGRKEGGRDGGGKKKGSHA